MTQDSDDLVDRNIGLLIRRWADPVDEARISRARLAFLERATSPVPSPRRWGLLSTAAGLLLCAAAYASLFLVGPLGGSPAQSGPRVQELIDDLAHPDVVKRDRAAAELATLGAKARPLLEQAVKGPIAEIRVRGKDVLDRMDAGKEAPAARDVELEKQRALVQKLDVECLQKALRINELMRQLDAANYQNAELKKKLEEAQKK